MRRILLTAVLIIAATTLLPVSVAETTADHPNSPLILMIHKNPRTLRIRGIASSTAHEIILRQTAQRYFGNATIDVDLGSGMRTPPGWALVTELVLRALAHTDAARASITAATVNIEGITTHPNEYAAALQRIESALLENMSMESSVSGISASTSFDELCQTRFRMTAKSGAIEFAVSTADFGQNALPLLDALIEIAVDCPETKIRVTGHTDSSGDAVANQALGHARAMRVIDYMAGRGVPVTQFEATVAISTQSDAAASDAASRRLGRRAELEMIVR